MSEATKSAHLRALPSVDLLLRTDAATSFRALLGASRLSAIARKVAEELRSEIEDGSAVQRQPGDGYTREALLDRAIEKLREACERESLGGIRRVINATGVILHTNLGRAPLSEAARAAVGGEAAGYCTLEYDATTGSRGQRGLRVEQLLIQLTEADDALVVNNCAAAALLILTVEGAGGETIVSRGELVEIGGDFRVPDVMANSGTRMIEVGTTNRTRVDDYRRAINHNTRLIMRVHPSNYRIVGFTTSPTVRDLAELAHESGLLLYEDAGSGALTNLAESDLGDEPVIKECLAQGADVVSFSGDKLLGSAQAGLIVGRGNIISRLRQHSLYRALRADKLRLAALEATLEAHLRGTSFSEVPALRMLTVSRREIEHRAVDFISQLSSRISSSDWEMEVIEGQSAVGGGSGPTTRPATALIALEHPTLSADAIEKLLRSSSPPVIARVSDKRVLIDLRTVAPQEEPELLAALLKLASH